MASTDALLVASIDSAVVHDSEGNSNELTELQRVQVEQDMSKPSRPPPKVFASPRKRSEAQVERRPEAHAMPRSQSVKAKLRKALAPYLTSTYLQGEMAKHFTKEYLAAHPPPQNEDELPLYVQQHLSELNRVTENWKGCVGRALDPMMHEWEVDERLQLMRAREEGRLRAPAPSGQLDGVDRRLQGGEDDDIEDLDLDPDVDSGTLPAIEGGLTSTQIFGAVHLVSDVKVWQQILAAQKAEERRQHAIAELHIHHAARIIQRSWRDFINQKKEEKARLDALVSPDVQAMLSAAAYKAMRDARNKLAVQKLRKSLSRRFRGFGSTMPRDLDPIVRPPGSAQLPSPPLSPRRKRGSLGSNPTTDRPEGVDGAEGAGASRSASPAHARSLSRSSTSDSRYKSFAARSARIITRLVSMKDLVVDDRSRGGGREGARADGGSRVGEVAGTDGSTGDGQSGLVLQPPRRSRVPNVALPRRRPSSDVGQEGVNGDVPGPPRRSRLSSMALANKRPSADGAKGTGDQQGNGEGGGASAPNQQRRYRYARGANKKQSSPGASGVEVEGRKPDKSGDWAVHNGGLGDADVEEGYQDKDEGAEDEFGVDEEEDSDSVCASGSELDEGEAAEAAMAEAEEVVEVAAELAKAFLGAGLAGDDSEEASDLDDGAGGFGPHIGDVALEALSVMEAAATGGVGGKMGLLEPSQLQAEGESGQEGATLSGRVAPRVHRGRSMTENTAELRCLIAGALAAAASPLLGRKNALAVAQMGFGELLQLPGAKTLLPKAAAAAAAARDTRSSSQGQTAEVPLASFGRGGGGGGGRGPLEIRAAALPTSGLPVSGRAVGGRRPHASDSGAVPAGPMVPAATATVAAAAAVTQNKAGLASARKSVTGETSDGSAPFISPRQQPGRPSQTGGAVTLPAVHPGPTSSLTGDVVLESSETFAAIRRYSQPSVSVGTATGNGSGGGIPYGTHSPTSSPTGISAAAAAARATQPWASPRRIRHPPGAHTISSSLPDPRVGATQTSGPREPTWLLPPINRSSTGPAVLGGGVTAALGAANVVARVPSDPNLQRQVHLQHGVAGGGGGGGGVHMGGGPGAMAAMAAAAAVGRARASAVSSSLDSSLQPYGGHSGDLGPPVVVPQTVFIINSITASSVAQRARGGYGASPSEAAAHHQP
ncbi:hypothetical protein VaNZ11_011113, partial [Volvox africanus]